MQQSRAKMLYVNIIFEKKNKEKIDWNLFTSGGKFPCNLCLPIITIWENCEIAV